MASPALVLLPAIAGTTVLAQPVAAALAFQSAAAQSRGYLLARVLSREGSLALGSPDPLLQSQVKGTALPRGAAHEAWARERGEKRFTSALQKGVGYILQDGLQNPKYFIG